MEFKLKYEGLWADIGEVMSIPTGTWRFQRPVIKAGKCGLCGWCSIFCPTGSIMEEDVRFAIDFFSCKGCGICAAICPNLAIKMVKELRE